ncbi:outer membrane protein [Candidatus Tisiphia endosymbiont of Oplodontha viridula]|uniref:outer membrane protein n=1 Tax=Candidatus Tisiphia endosymbiont of Oplodontha viridula TaxID=3077925 RepID=UPI0035C8D6D7
MNKLPKILSTIYIYSLFFANAQAEEINADQRFFYIGTEAGIVEPVVKKFRHNSGTGFTLKRSKMYSGKIGYSFYPQMAIELSVTHQPKYRLHYVLPQKELAPSLIIPQTPGITKVISNIYMINLVYDLDKVQEITPFVILGAGVARVKVSSASSHWDLMNVEYFRIKTTRSNCFAWQVGLGFSKELSSNFSIDAAVKLQAAHSIKINYATLDMKTQQFIPATPIKKTIGVGEFGIGFTYKLPI